MVANVETMAYYGETPWHGLGTQVEGAMTSTEALKASGLDWTVSKQPIFVHTATQVKAVEGKYAIMRDTDESILGVVGSDYSPMQNGNAFTFFDNVVGGGEAFYHTCGSLDGGKRIWILAKLPNSINIKGDITDKYLLLANGHDGFQVVRMLYTPVRVVCQNTLTAALGNLAGFYSRHTSGMMNRVQVAQDALGITKKWYSTFEEQANFLANKTFTPDAIPALLQASFQPKKVLAKMFGEEVTAEEDFSTRWNNTSELVTAFITAKQKGYDSPAIKDTAYGALNGIVEFLDYGKRYHSPDIRFKNVFGQQGLAIKSRALEYLVKV